MALGMISYHIRISMILLEAGETNTVAVYDTKARKLVIVAVNDGEAREIVFDLSRFAGVDGPIFRWITGPKASARSQTLPGRYSTASPSHARLQHIPSRPLMREMPRNRMPFRKRYAKEVPECILIAP